MIMIGKVVCAVSQKLNDGGYKEKIDRYCNIFNRIAIYISVMNSLYESFEWY